MISFVSGAPREASFALQGWTVRSPECALPGRGCLNVCGGVVCGVVGLVRVVALGGGWSSIVALVSIVSISTDLESDRQISCIVYDANDGRRLTNISSSSSPRPIAAQTTWSPLQPASLRPRCTQRYFPATTFEPELKCSWQKRRSRRRRGIGPFCCPFKC